MFSPRARRLMLWTGLPLLAIVLLVLFWSWAWFIPLVERQASAALGRPVHVGGLDVNLGRVPEVVLTDLRIDNPEGYPADPPFAAVPRLSLRVDAWAFLRHRQIILPAITVERPAVRLLARGEGDNNYTFPFAQAAEGSPAEPGPQPQIGALRVLQGEVHASLDPLGAEMQVAVETQDAPGAPSRLHAKATGTYAKQPITAELLGGAVLSLREAGNPWPVRLDLANGPTQVRLEGTVQDPLHFAGANLQLNLRGPDLALLSPLTGVVVPTTPPYRLSGKLDYAEGQIRFTGMEGVLGHSDLAGDVAVEPRGTRPIVRATLRSRRVDLEDLAGFVGGTPENKPKPRRVGGRVLPDTPVNLPRLRAADVHLNYDAGQIRGRAMPLDNMHVKLDIVDGAIALHPLRFGIGKGSIDGNFDFAPVEGGGLKAKGEVKFRQVDVSRLMGVTPLGEGQGGIGGAARVETQGRTLAEMLGRGDGGLTLAMAGGNLSALLVDLSGVQIGNALLSALGLPARTRVQCFVADMDLRKGVLSTRTVLLDTEDSLISGMGEVDLGKERLNYTLRTEAKHFTVGSLPTDILLRGTFADPSVRPEVVELGARVGAAVGLGAIALPLAILPTIQFGIGEDNRCEGLVKRAR
ncbi:AsmA family protein [Roseomonas sp. M0104]|uniref:AsmA family protein n=1 Tax=Teichococcus coralli TaxID=2545983 RepID=A0A845BF21_9PROT|nr:AsmA family protein [Pseudoroseomonas coralli]MXP65711.1 AsmA family protein [Pseudoroseomonas coralli]